MDNPEEEVKAPDGVGSPPTPPFELIVGDIGGEILNGDVPVRWCVTPSLVQQLENDGIIDPHILLISATTDMVEMQRQMVPLTELMTYVRFTRAGEMRLHGFILDGKKGRKRLHSDYMKKTSGDYGTDVFFHYNNELHDDLPHEHDRTSVNVIIPEGVFGKEPNELVKWYVNYWHTSNKKIVDECHFRQRLILGVTLKWIPFTIWTMMLIAFHLFVSGGFALAGFYKNNKVWRSFRPHKYLSLEYNIMDDVNLDWKECKFLLHRKYTYHKGTDSEFDKDMVMLLSIPFFPITLLVQGIIVGIFAEYFGQVMLYVTGTLFVVLLIVDLCMLLVNWLENTEIFVKFFKRIGNKIDTLVDWMEESNRLKYIKWIAMGVIAVISLFVILAFMTWAATFLVPIIAIMFASVIWGDKWMIWLDNAYTVRPEDNNYGEIKELLCPREEANLLPDYNFIPPKQRTFRLWYLDLKHKVCKPMQQ